MYVTKCDLMALEAWYKSKWRWDSSAPSIRRLWRLAKHKRRDMNYRKWLPNEVLFYLCYRALEACLKSFDPEKASNKLKYSILDRFAYYFGRNLVFKMQDWKQKEHLGMQIDLMHLRESGYPLPCSHSTPCIAFIVEKPDRDAFVLSVLNDLSDLERRLLTGAISCRSAANESSQTRYMIKKLKEHVCEMVRRKMDKFF